MSPRASAATLPERFARHLQSSCLLDGARSVVIACSGGGDSTALLLLLEPWCRERGVAPLVSHVAHRLRGAAGDGDARFAAELAASLDLPFSLLTVDVPKRRRKGESLEAAARRLRYGALLGLAGQIGKGTLVATGHTLDDQAETVLLNLARRLGRTRGGIRACRADGIVRPLLPFSRVELREFLLSRGVAWREDETNENERLLRNRIRRRDLPALEAGSPGTSVRLARAADVWSARLEALDRRIDAALDESGIPLAGPWPRRLLSELGAEAAGRLLVRSAGLSGAVPGRVQVRRAVARLLGTEKTVREALAGRRLVADEKAVRLLRARDPPDRLDA